MPLRFQSGMRSLSKKLRVIYSPFLLIAAGCVAGYSFLNWLLLIKAGLLTLDEDFVSFWIPFGIPWIPIHFWLRPRIRGLRLKRGGADLPWLYCFVAAVAIAIPTMVAQAYLATASGSISHLERISQINQRPITKYYTVEDILFAKGDSVAETRAHVSGRYNENLDAYVYLACPLEDSVNHSPICTAWLAVEYGEQMSSRLAEGEREARLRGFLQRSLTDYAHSDLRQFAYLERVGGGEERRGVEAALTRSPRWRPGTRPTLLKAHQDSFEARNGHKLAWVFGSFGIGAAVWLLMLVVAPIDRTEMDRLLSGELPKGAGEFRFYRLLLPTRRVFATPLLLDVNLLVFVGMVTLGMGFLSFDGEDLLAAGANFRPAIESGQFWRLVTSLFIHGGAIHLLGNFFGLLLVGLVLEQMLGGIRVLVCYFLCGTAASVASVAWHPATVSVGASGAVFGLWGVLLGHSLVGASKSSVSRKDHVKLALFFLGYNLLFGLLMPGIDHAAHLGGLGFGFLVGMSVGIFPGLLSPERGSRQGSGL